MSCPICKADTIHKYRPFCSKHCADVDLARWFSGSYALEEVDEEARDKSEITPFFRGDADS